MSSDPNSGLPAYEFSPWKNVENDLVEFDLFNELQTNEFQNGGQQTTHQQGMPQEVSDSAQPPNYSINFDSMFHLPDTPPEEFLQSDTQPLVAAAQVPDQQTGINSFLETLNMQTPMSTQPPVVVRVVRRRRPKPSEDEGNNPSDAIEPIIQQPSASFSVSGNQTSNTFQAVRVNPNILMPMPVFNSVSQASSLAMTQQQQQQTHTVTKSGGVVDVPALTDMEGEYGFSVTIEEKERTTKSPMWLMSHISNKLYTNINKSVPFEIRLKKKVPNDKSFYVRAVAVFSSAQFLRTNVTRCPNHASTADITNHDFPYPAHVVRADHPEAKYEENPNGRLSVIVPLDILVDGSDYTPILLRFMCLGSCVGGINRRPIAIILTLENAMGQVCGRKVIDVRVCACPTRDIRTDEQAILNRNGKRRGSSMQEKPRKKPKMIEPKIEPQDEDDKIFTIQVRGRKLYEFMMLVKESYMKTHPEYMDRYHDQRYQNEEDSEDELLKTSNIQASEVESDSVSWESGCNYNQQVGIGFCNDSEVDLLSGSKSSSPLSKLKPNISISPSSVSIGLWPDLSNLPSSQEECQENRQSSKTSESINDSKLVGISVNCDSVPFSKTSVTYSQGSKKDDLVSKHIPVMQVESYQPRATTVKAKPTQLFKHKSDMSKGDKGKRMSVKKNITERLSHSSFERPKGSVEMSPRKQLMSPDSSEMLAANVLAEGFKGKTDFKTMFMK